MIDTMAIATDGYIAKERNKFSIGVSGYYITDIIVVITVPKYVPSYITYVPYQKSTRLEKEHYKLNKKQLEKEQELKKLQRRPEEDDEEVLLFIQLFMKIWDF